MRTLQLCAGILLLAAITLLWNCKHNIFSKADNDKVAYLRQKGIEVCDTYSEEACGACGCCGKPTDCLCPIVIIVDGKYREARQKSASGDHDYIRNLFINGNYREIPGFSKLWDGVVDSIINGYYSFYFKGSCAINNQTTDMWLVTDKQTGKVKWAIRWKIKDN